MAILVGGAVLVVGLAGFGAGVATGLYLARTSGAQGSGAPGTSAATGGSAGAVAHPAITDAWLTFASDPHDYIGQGERRTFTINSAAFTLGGTSGGASASVNASPDEQFEFHFVPPQGRGLAIGGYDNAQRWPFQSPVAPGMDIDGAGRGCNQLSGDFQVIAISFDATGSITEFDVAFDQHCELASPALRGELWATTIAGHHKSATAGSTA